MAPGQKADDDVFNDVVPPDNDLGDLGAQALVRVLQ